MMISPLFYINYRRHGYPASADLRFNYALQQRHCSFGQGGIFYRRMFRCFGFSCFPEEAQALRFLFVIQNSL